MAVVSYEMYLISKIKQYHCQGRPDFITGTLCNAILTRTLDRNCCISWWSI